MVQVEDVVVVQVKGQVEVGLVVGKVFGVQGEVYVVVGDQFVGVVQCCYYIGIGQVVGCYLLQVGQLYVGELFVE